MNKVFLTLLALNMLGTVAFCQSNYKPGFIIKSNGNRAEGYINLREWESSPQYIDFKTTLNDKEPLRFGPEMLKSFEVNGLKKYITYMGKISMDANEVPNLPLALDTSARMDTVFLEVRYDGSPIRLLSHQDHLKTRLFAQENNSKPVELILHRYYLQDRSYRTVEIFKNTLLLLAEKYKAGDVQINTQINDTRFREPEIYKVLRLINNDKSEKKIGDAGTRFFAGAGVNNITTTMTGIYGFDGKQSSTVTPSFSIGVDIFPNKLTQKLFFRVELSYVSISPKFVGDPIANGTENTFELKQNTLAATPQVLYNFFNTNNVKVFAGIGANFNYSSYSDLKSTVNGLELQNLEMKKLWLSFPVRAGVTLYNKFEVFAFYTPDAPFTDYVRQSIKSRFIGAGVHYNITR